MHTLLYHLSRLLLLSVCLCIAERRLWAAEYEPNNSGLSGGLCWRWERAAVLRPSQYLDVVAFLCPFLIQAEPSGREPGKGWEGKARVNTGNNANGATHNATGKLSQHQLTTKWKMEHCVFKWRLKRERCKKSNWRRSFSYEKKSLQGGFWGFYLQQKQQRVSRYAGGGGLWIISKVF